MPLLTGSYVQVRMKVARDNPPMLIPAAALVFNADGNCAWPWWTRASTFIFRLWKSKGILGPTSACRRD